jgi:hypothetical protein
MKERDVAGFCSALLSACGTASQESIAPVSHDFWNPSGTVRQQGVKGGGGRVVLKHSLVQNFWRTALSFSSRFLLLQKSFVPLAHLLAARLSFHALLASTLLLLLFRYCRSVGERKIPISNP